MMDVKEWGTSALDEVVPAPTVPIDVSTSTDVDKPAESNSRKAKDAPSAGPPTETYSSKVKGVRSVLESAHEFGRTQSAPVPSSSVSNNGDDLPDNESFTIPPELAERLKKKQAHKDSASVVSSNSYDDEAMASVTINTPRRLRDKYQAIAARMFVDMLINCWVVYEPPGRYYYDLEKLYPAIIARAITIMDRICFAQTVCSVFNVDEKLVSKDLTGSVYKLVSQKFFLSAFINIVHHDIAPKAPTDDATNFIVAVSRAIFIATKKYHGDPLLAPFAITRPK